MDKEGALWLSWDKEKVGFMKPIVLCQGAKPQMVKISNVDHWGGNSNEVGLDLEATAKRLGMKPGDCRRVDLVIYDESRKEGKRR